MPVYPCRHPTCRAFVHRRGDGCPAHAGEAREVRAERHRYYDQHARDPDAKEFYNSREWRDARAIKLATDPVCQRCIRAWANTVHHVKPLRDCTPEERTADANLMSMCGDCHSQLEAEIAAAARRVGGK